MQRYINIHTHRPAGPQEWALQNGLPAAVPPQTGWYSAGIHPWHVTAQWQQDMPRLKATALQPNVLAIGECGLDKTIPVPFALQQQAFAAQIDLANELHKPLVAHCVRAYNEVAQQLKTAGSRVPCVFHGFNKSKSLAQQLVQQGYYLSFGRALGNERLQETFRQLPLDKIFLETDDSGMDIKAIYTIAAATLHIPVETLALQIEKNAATVLGWRDGQ